MSLWRASAIFVVMLVGCSKDENQCPCPAAQVDAGTVSPPPFSPTLILPEMKEMSVKAFTGPTEVASMFASAERHGRVFDLGSDWDKVTRSVRDMNNLFPWVVAVGAPGSWKCSGIVIAPSRVLTAFHCKIDGFVSVGGVAGSSERVVEVVDRDPREALDLKVLRLKSPITPWPQMKLAGRCVEDGLKFPVAVRLVGFGLQRPDGRGLWGTRTSGDNSLHALSCAGATHAVPCRDAVEFAMAASGRSDTCEGDSGGPLVASWKGEDVVVAVTSRPIDGWRGCGRGGIYVKAWADSQWLKDHGALITQCP